MKGNCFTTCTDLKEGKAGRKEVDGFMRSPGYDDIYIAGDGIWYLEDGKPVPQIVEAAEQTAETAARNIIVDIDVMLGGPVREYHTYKGSYHGFMVSIGSKYAVSHTGGISLSGFPAMALKHVVNMYYLFTAAGVNAVWAYLKHEILDIRQGRSLIGSFAEWKVPTYWVLPLRVYLGCHVAHRGHQKDLRRLARSGQRFCQRPDSRCCGGRGSAGPRCDAVAQRGVGGGRCSRRRAEVVAWATPLLAEPWGLYVWFSQWTVNLAPISFQSGIVIFEILIGLAFIGGAFTWLAAAASFLFSIMLIVGAMTDASIFWYMVAALALMGGAGKAFGLDYWIMPFVKKWWNGTALARKTFLYVGEPTIKSPKR